MKTLKKIPKHIFQSFFIRFVVKVCAQKKNIDGYFYTYVKDLDLSKLMERKIVLIFPELLF